MEINPLTLNRYIKGITLRSCKTDKIDAEHIAFFLSDLRVSYKPYRFSSYHIQELKSLTRERESLIKERSKQLVKITNILDKIFRNLRSSLIINFQILQFIFLININHLLELHLGLIWT